MILDVWTPSCNNENHKKSAADKKRRMLKWLKGVKMTWELRDDEKIYLLSRFVAEECHHFLWYKKKEGDVAIPVNWKERRVVLNEWKGNLLWYLLMILTWKRAPTLKITKIVNTIIGGKRPQLLCWAYSVNIINICGTGQHEIMVVMMMHWGGAVEEINLVRKDYWWWHNIIIWCEFFYSYRIIYIGSGFSCSFYWPLRTSKSITLTN